MKNLFVLIGLSITVVFCNEQELQEKDVPAAVREALQKQFPEAKNVEWTKEVGKFEASFKHNEKETSAQFTEAGIAEETEVEIKKEELPASVLSYISANHKGAKIKEAAKITKASGEIIYEAEVKGKDLLFDSTRKFLMAKEAKNEDKD